MQAGKLVDQLEGADAAQLTGKVDQHIKLGAPMASQPPAASKPAAGADASMASAAASRPDPTAAAPQASTSAVSLSAKRVICAGLDRPFENARVAP